ncbi:MAG: chloride channel protein [Gammaproteobacteria bacterium]|nr:chloride channel protein [Gammaproteobacteria bacterium]
MQKSIHHWLDLFRLQISSPDAIFPLSILGMIAGVFAALTIIVLRLLVDYVQIELFPIDVAEDFESMSSIWRLGVPIAGGLLIGLLFYLTPKESQTVGVLHILERLEQHQGRLPWINAVVQFVGGAISMIAGHSVGREGPSAHLGAASSNLPAQALGLPNNSLRILLACGAAAGIAASFNTPLAGAAFAMEVLLMEYTVAGFAPIIMATVSATALTRAVFGSDLAYSVPSVTPGALAELPYILLCGILVGLLAGSFNKLFELVTFHAQKMSNWMRPVAAGLLVGLCGLLLPEVMGSGDDTVNSIISGELEVQLLLGIVVVKIIATVGGIGLGLPGGIIGPTLFIGAAIGGLLCAVGAIAGFNDISSFGLYTMIGMGSMMAGTMMAPLAGLIAILELTGEPNIIWPGMLAVVAATITSGYFTQRQSLFHGLMRARGLDYRSDPMVQSLRRIGVGGVMDRRVVVLPQQVTLAQVDKALGEQPIWILIRETEQPDTLLAAVDLARAIQEFPDEKSYDLLEIPGERLQTASIDNRATLQEAQEKLEQTGLKVLYVVGQTVPGIPRLYGVLTISDIESSYRY